MGPRGGEVRTSDTGWHFDTLRRQTEATMSSLQRFHDNGLTGDRRQSEARPQFSMPSLFDVPGLRAQREIACRRCRQRKKKCDKRRPVCGECSRSGADCIPLAPKKSTTSTFPPGYVRQLENYIASLELQLGQSDPDSGDHFPPDIPAMGMGASNVVEVLQLPSDEPSNLDIAEIPDWISDRMGEDFTLIPSPINTFTPTFAGQGADFCQLPNERYCELEIEPGIDDGQNEDQEDIETRAQAENDVDLDDEAGDQAENDEDPDVEVLQGTRMEAENKLSPCGPPQNWLAQTHLSLTLAQRYASEYFTSAHIMWPFLHHRQWAGWWTYWAGLTQCQDAFTPDARTSFVDMVVSIGALLTYGTDPKPDHLHFSQKFYHRAVARNTSHSMMNLPAVMRTQYSLLLTIRAMHVDSVQDLFEHASTAIQSCVLSDPSRRRPEHVGSASETSLPSSSPPPLETTVRKMTARTCRVIQILLLNTMERKVLPEETSLEHYDNVGGEDNDNSACIADSPSTDSSISSEELFLSSCQEKGQAPPSPSDVAMEEHMVRLRQIQYHILRLVGKLQHDAITKHHPIPNLWRSWLRHDLERWKEMAASLSDRAEHHHKFLSRPWVLKLADYTIISLFPNPALAVRGGDSKYLVAAACSVLVTFRKLRVKDHVTCHTWTALLHQFQAGVCIVFCLWATPTHQQHGLYDCRAVSQAFFSCLATLVDFATKWETARVFRDIFELLMDAVPISQFGDPSQSWSLHQPCKVALREMIDELSEVKIQQKVTDMLSMMARESRPSYSSLSIEETHWIQYEHVI
ncbi:hypothetical protein Neosp_014732 [[Neocosmospora] mangrovei]